MVQQVVYHQYDSQWRVTIHVAVITGVAVDVLKKLFFVLLGAHWKTASKHDSYQCCFKVCIFFNTVHDKLYVYGVKTDKYIEKYLSVQSKKWFIIYPMAVLKYMWQWVY